MKQHLRVVHVHSYKPQAIWNQLFLALITALLVQEMNTSLPRKITPWQLLKLMEFISIYRGLPWKKRSFAYEEPPKGNQQERGRNQKSFGQA
ncbi:hypothetical protein [Paenibacillus typhae]|uniref:hypothetical protein n=1 Tax=Paenibacillus typhae TaxID=1174501 RepID=UPI0024466A0C|nr:hypothetical protein [Paenibacillus typhae]